MQQNGWHILTITTREFPADGQEIYCCIADTTSLSAVKRVKTEKAAFEDLLSIHPHWQIFWMPISSPPHAPCLTPVPFSEKEAPHGKHAH